MILFPCPIGQQFWSKVANALRDYDSVKVHKICLIDSQGEIRWSIQDNEEKFVIWKKRNLVLQKKRSMAQHQPLQEEGLIRPVAGSSGNNSKRLAIISGVRAKPVWASQLYRGDRTHVGRFQHFRYNTFNICPITFLTNAMNEAWPSLPPEFFSEYSAVNFFLKLILNFLTILDTTGVILDRSLSHVGQSRYGQ